MRKKAYRDSYVAAHLSNTVAAQIAAMRESRGWTQAELANKSGMKQSRISSLEDPNYENFEAGTLRRIASAFDVGLSIKFVPYSEVVKFVSEISDDVLDVPSFENDALTQSRAASSITISVAYDEKMINPYRSFAYNPISELHWLGRPNDVAAESAATRVEFAAA